MTSAKDIAAKVDIKAHAKRLAKLIVPAHIKLLELAWEGERERLPVLGAFDLKNPAVKRTIKTLSKSIVGISQTTRADILATLEAALTGAEKIPSTAEIAKRIRAAGVIVSKSRSVAIARTETATAMTQGSLLSWEESGVVKEIEWLASEDEATDDICSELNGKRVKLGEDFDGYMPPAHTNCRCAVLPVIGD